MYGHTGVGKGLQCAVLPRFTFFLVGRRSAVPSIVRSLFPLLSFSSIMFSQARRLASGHAGLHALSRFLFFEGINCAFRAGRQAEK